MKLILTALTIAATMFASSASAFEANTTQLEENRLKGKIMVGDLAVGVKGLLDKYGSGWCIRKGKYYFYSFADLETDPSEYESYYEIIKQGDGEFTVTYGPAENGGKNLPLAWRSKCDKLEGNNPGVTFYPVKSVNGFTDRRSLLIDLINKGYE